ncbi:16S rRNA (guanine(527)-N(7))-methyltransferase RsmG [Rhodobacter sp. NSM]|uniref:16S rRNA (guanine(527)-N(7))-methyltransferase RsmG n=1 Tax=Rhodobacter sp. NSM TaxID=3457501 RepID=UPI003FCFC3E6
MEESAVLAALDVSRETSERLRGYANLVRKWNPAINLVSASTLPAIWSRHIMDSAQLWRYRPARFDLWLDLGSGSGFPGIVIAILAAASASESQFVLVESDKRKATFLRTACRELGLSATIQATRVEDLPPQEADVISARALAPLPDLCRLSDPHLARHGICLFPKGAGHAAEIAAARQSWNMDLEIHTSLTDPEAVILKLRALAHV